MAKVIEFPSTLVRNLAEVERVIDTLAAQIGCGSAVAASVFDAVRPIVEILSERATFSAPASALCCHEASQALSEQINVFLIERNRRIIYERIEAEFLRHRPSADA